MSVASLSLDLDNEWSYLKTHGDPAWATFPSYLDTVVPRFIEVLGDMHMPVTVFIVGQDAAIESNHAALRMIPAAGHSVGNHSFHHEPWLHAYSNEQIATEIDAATDAIVSATGSRPIGFRGPGFSLSDATLRTLAERGYAYDASTLPTYIGPLARAYYFMTAKLTPEEREKRKALFGGVKDGLRPIRPYQWNLGDRTLLEVPVTTFPLLKIPIHFSYVLYLATFSKLAAMTYFRAAMATCRALRVEPSLLLHPLDFIGGDDCASLAFFPAMQQRATEKIAVLRSALEILAGSFDVISLDDHARRLLAGTPHLRERTLAVAN
jgi:peptidoglycan/xylan/chitin deacetylase (PgdA/CDA1 family)